MMNPGAMCVFLDAASRDPSGPAGLLAAAAGRGEDPGALADALAAIASGNPGQKHPPAAVAAMEAAIGASGGGTPPQDTGQRLTLGLALGVYRGVPVEDVMAHWKMMQEGSSALSRLTPTVQVMGEVAVLSVEGVPQELAAGACEAAERAGAGCLAAY